MGAEDEKKILDGEGGYVPAGDGDLTEPLPELIRVKREMIVTRGKPNVKLDEDARAADQGQLADRLNVGGLLVRGHEGAGMGSPRRQEMPGAREVAVREEQVDVGELAQSEVAVGEDSQRRALVGDGLDSVGAEA
jgi:hypothetical protein